MKVTQWFGPFSNPKYIGHYESYPFEAYDSDDARMTYWNGEEWLGEREGNRMAFQTRMWRGMVERKVPTDDLQQQAVTDSERLVWAMNNMGLRNMSEFVKHVLRRGGDGDLSDCRTFIDDEIRKEKA